VTVCRGSLAAVPETSRYGLRFVRSQKLRFIRSQQETIMHKVVLTAVAVAALSMSAAAQQAGMIGQPQTGQQMQPQGSAQALAGYRISPQQLNASQIREIQQALEERAEQPVRVDGEWGPDTEEALKSFQQALNMISQSGELDILTIIALGLDPSSFGVAGAGETTGQAPDTSQPQPMQGTPQQTMPQPGR